MCAETMGGGGEEGFFFCHNLTHGWLLATVCTTDRQLNKDGIIVTADCCWYVKHSSFLFFFTASKGF